MFKDISILLACALAAGPAGVTAASAAARSPDSSARDLDSAAGDRAARGQIEIVVNLAEQRAYVYRNGMEIAESEASTGKEGHETPTGVFTILEKQRFHRSSRYNDAPMPFMQRLTWYGVALHGGEVPGYAASHGCIRLPLAFARKLFGMTQVGTKVVVTDGEPAADKLDPAHASSPPDAAPDEPSPPEDAAPEQPIPDDPAPDAP